MAGSEGTIEILKEILNEIRGARADANERFGVVEAALLDLIEESRSIAESTRASAERDARLEPRLSALEDRVGKLESK
ncbi:MAG TPA: hypothetical protein VH853_12535 [Polyangia bacterium]|jgi:hypothetical protein|nr:hypothetical protein [Polyangia bacterium]